MNDQRPKVIGLKETSQHATPDSPGNGQLVWDEVAIGIPVDSRILIDRHLVVIIDTDVILTMTGHMTVEITMIETMETTQTIISVDAGVGDVAGQDAEAIRHQMMSESLQGRRTMSNANKWVANNYMTRKTDVF